MVGRGGFLSAGEAAGENGAPVGLSLWQHPGGFGAERQISGAMAGKKRRADKPPAQPKSSFSVEAKTRLPSGGSGADGVQTWLLPALGALGLVGAWLALLGGFADGTIDWRLIFNVDTVAPRVQFRELFLRQDGPGWATSGTAPYYFPDVLTQWALAALGAGVMAALYLAPLLQAALAAAGWIVVCDFLFGKSPARRCAVLLLQALPLLVVAWRGPDLFYAQLSTVSHYGVWTLLPWLLWLSLRVVDSDSPGKPGKRRGARIPAAFSVGLGFFAGGGGCQRLVYRPLVCRAGRICRRAAGVDQAAPASSGRPVCRAARRRMRPRPGLCASCPLWPGWSSGESNIQPTWALACLCGRWGGQPPITGTPPCAIRPKPR